MTPLAHGTDFGEAAMPRSALSRLPGDPVSMMGHNQGPPLDAARRWRTHCWRAARKQTLKKLPIEIVRRRVARAKALGLAYPAYASILLGSGRDIVGFLFTAEAIGLRLERAARRGEPLPVLATAAAGKLSVAPMATRGFLVPVALLAEAGDRVGAALNRLGTGVGGMAPAPVAEATDPDGRRAIRAVLDPLGLPGDAVVMVGARADERRWAEAARLARFIAAPVYFASPEAGA